VTYANELPRVGLRYLQPAGGVVVAVDEGGAALVVVDEGAQPLVVDDVVLRLLDLDQLEGALLAASRRDRDLRLLAVAADVVAAAAVLGSI
jgi:hypothetical protein